MNIDNMIDKNTEKQIICIKKMIENLKSAMSEKSENPLIDVLNKTMMTEDDKKITLETLNLIEYKIKNSLILGDSIHYNIQNVRNKAIELLRGSSGTFSRQVKLTYHVGL